MGPSGSRGNRTASGTIRELVDRSPVVSFVVVTFAWSWGYWAAVGAFLDPTSITYLVTLPGLWGPAIAAVTIAQASGTGVRQFLDRCLRSSVGIRWYAVAFGGATAVGVVGPLVQGLLADTGFELNPIGPIAATAVAIFAGGSEELGWRGVAHPFLRDRLNALSAGLLIGAVWVVWHVPLLRLGVGFDGPLLLFGASAAAISVLLGWLYDSTSGSVLPAVVAHAALDAPPLLSPTGSVPDDVLLTSQFGTLAVYWLLVAALLVGNGPRLSSGSPPSPPDAAAADSAAPSDRPGEPTQSH